MTTCYEHLRKRTKQDTEAFHRLNNYFYALENNQLVEYHDKRGRYKKNETSG